MTEYHGPQGYPVMYVFPLMYVWFRSGAKPCCNLFTHNEGVFLPFRGFVNLT